MTQPSSKSIKMLCYSISPNEYLNDHAGEIAQIYDGFFFTIGSWEEGISRSFPLAGNPPQDPAWLSDAKRNLQSLRKAGVTENLIDVLFAEEAAWPSPETLLSKAYTRKMKSHFHALGKAAKDLGFRGVSIDTEYPYPRFELDHKIYTYNSYTPGDLMAAAFPIRWFSPCPALCAPVPCRSSSFWVCSRSWRNETPQAVSIWARCSLRSLPCSDSASIELSIRTVWFILAFFA